MSNSPSESSNAVDRMFLDVYEDLRAWAEAHLATWKPGQTLQATALVNEAYLRMKKRGRDWDNTEHLSNAAKVEMRHILGDHDDSKKAARHGGGWQRLDLLLAELKIAPDDEQEQQVDEVVAKLSAEKPDLGRIVRLRFFEGLTMDDIAEQLGLPRRTLYRRMDYILAWLRSELSSEPEA